MVEKIAAPVAMTGAQGPAAGANFATQLAKQTGSASPAARPAVSSAPRGAEVDRAAQSAGVAGAPKAHTGPPRCSRATEAAPSRPLASHAVRPLAAKPVAHPASPSQAAPIEKPGGVELLSEVQQAQQRLDQILKLAESGRTFSPAELLAFQAHTYRASQELEMASKVVEKGTSAVKQTLQTQI